MKLGAQDRDKIIRYGVIGGGLLVVITYGYLQLRTPDAPPPPVAPVVTSAPAKSSPRGNAVVTPSSPGAVPKSADATSAAKVGVTAAQYDPTLHMEAMLVTESLVYGGSGRNVFSPNSAPAVVNIPKPIAPVRPVGVVLPVYTAPPGPPPPPPIDLKFFGTATLADGTREAFLLHGEDVFLAATGSIVQRRYKIGTVSAASVEVEDMGNNNKQNLPLQRN